jgi:hypothetical protein
MLAALVGVGGNESGVGEASGRTFGDIQMETIEARI